MIWRSFFFKTIATTTKIKLLETPLVKYRQDNPLSSINNPAKIFCVCDEYDELTKFLNDNKKLKEIYNSQKLINQYKAYLWNLKRLDLSLQAEFLNKFQETFKGFMAIGEIDRNFYKAINRLDFYLLVNKPELFVEKVVKKNMFYLLKPVWRK